MKYLKLFESFDESEIHKICKQYNIKNYTINNDGSIDVNDEVYLNDKGLTKLPLKFNKVNKYFSCSHNKLTSLEGSPVEVNDNFWCNSNLLTSLKGAPKIIRGVFDCSYNNINTFEYFPSHVGNGFWCENNPIFVVWVLFKDDTKIELLNDFDIFRDEDTNIPGVVMDRLNDFLLTIGKDPAKSININRYKNI